MRARRVPDDGRSEERVADECGAWADGGSEN
ncbi:hypothetical protein SFR_1358 [Streptomyces sp. FR-008]|nr:hypothetical protein SFR_1358 [Streptomyces sp. FR-008]